MPWLNDTCGRHLATDQAEASRIMRPKTLYHKSRASISPQRVDQLELPYQNPLYLIETDRIVGKVIQLGRAR